jgi:hypothetical protein
MEPFAAENATVREPGAAGNQAVRRSGRGGPPLTALPYLALATLADYPSNGCNCLF